MRLQFTRNYYYFDWNDFRISISSLGYNYFSERTSDEIKYQHEIRFADPDIIKKFNLVAFDILLLLRGIVIITLGSSAS
jgi:hypothetical protein